MRTAYLFVLTLLSAGVLLVGCSSSGPSVRTVSPADFQSQVSKPGTQVVDVRTPVEFAAGHLAGAVNLDVEASGFAEQVAELDKSVTYAVYCRSGNRSKTATQQMADSGVATIYELAGGINAWVAAGYPVGR